MLNDMVLELFSASGIDRVKLLIWYLLQFDLKDQITMDPKILGVLNAISVGGLDDSDWITYMCQWY